jgi:lysine 2,3-aminomutase
MTWQDEYRDSLRTPEDLELFFGNKFPKLKGYSVLIPKVFAKKIKVQGPHGPLWKQFLPDLQEQSSFQERGLIDPIGDQLNNKAPQLIHRYDNRALFTPTTICPVLCRYCFRKNELGENLPLFKSKFKETLNYLRENPQIEEIIFTGGDPLILSDQQLAFYFEEFSKIKSLKYLRLHTRTPIIIPSRITEGFIKTIRQFQDKFKVISMAIHVNHSDEIDQEVEKALLKCKNRGIMMLSQTVLLKGVNDSLSPLIDLFSRLVDFGIRPYYLHHPDKAKGAMHFYLNLEEGRKIYSQIRNKLPGWAIPRYIIDIPGGEGKVNAFNPEGFHFSGNLINRKGEIIKYLTEPTQ